MNSREVFTSVLVWLWVRIPFASHVTRLFINLEMLLFQLFVTNLIIIMGKMSVKLPHVSVVSFLIGSFVLILIIIQLLVVNGFSPTFYTEQ